MIVHFPLSPLGLEEGSGSGYRHGQYLLFPNWDCDGETLHRAALMGQARMGLHVLQGHKRPRGPLCPLPGPLRVAKLRRRGKALGRDSQVFASEVLIS